MELFWNVRKLLEYLLPWQLNNKLGAPSLIVEDGGKKRTTNLLSDSLTVHMPLVLLVHSNSWNNNNRH